MKRLLTLSALLLFSVDVFAEEQRMVCDITDRKWEEQIGLCKKGDVLKITTTSRSSREKLGVLMARVCDIDDALYPNDFLPPFVLCNYTGDILPIVSDENRPKDYSRKILGD